MDGSKGWDYHFLQGLWYRSYVDIRFKELDNAISSITNKEEVLDYLSVKTGLNFKR
ncbi:hypothetical protein AWD60_004524 [Escherichia coli]|nr:hypothetical protein [Escherichia coli]EGX07303.1 hypothetical protein ECG581_2448 [Escherichia coli G58-1]EFI3063967.1 hypothetical protein [Escherichia coli]EFM2055310.1 hypothetical protein [Escherichia coli]EFU8309323.1 hypothetical protein [Escherichia coli]EGM5971954.1 hypothetical protein [Escherichia coli]